MWSGISVSSLLEKKNWNLFGSYEIKEAMGFADFSGRFYGPFVRNGDGLLHINTLFIHEILTCHM